MLEPDRFRKAKYHISPEKDTINEDFDICFASLSKLGHALEATNRRFKAIADRYHYCN